LIRRALTALAYLLVLLLAVGVVGPLRQAALAAPLLSDLIGHPRSAASDVSSFQVRADLPPLWPGAQGVVQAQVSSRADAPAGVRVQSITAVVADPSRACSAQNLSIPPYTWVPGSITYTLQPGQTVVVPMKITMPDTGRDQNACQGVAFPVQFTLTTAPV
jgi:hypothetical protein